VPVAVTVIVPITPPAFGHRTLKVGDAPRGERVIVDAPLIVEVMRRVEPEMFRVVSKSTLSITIEPLLFLMVEPDSVWTLIVVLLIVVIVARVPAMEPSVARPTTTRVPLALRFWNTVDIF